METNTRPKLTDPQEWDIVRGMYFDSNNPLSSENKDPLEELERLESRLKNNNISSR